MKARCAVLFAAVFLFAGVLGVSAQDEGVQAWEDEITRGFRNMGIEDFTISFRVSKAFQTEWATMPYAERRLFPVSIFEVDGTFYAGEWWSQIAKCPNTYDLAMNAAIIRGAIAGQQGTIAGQQGKSVDGNFAMLFDTSGQRRHIGRG